MSYKIRIEKEVGEVLAKWKKSRPQMLKKFKKIYLELLEHPTTGTGHPEALKGRDGITYSRHLTAHDRILYNIYEEKIIVVFLEVGGHYNDK